MDLFHHGTAERGSFVGPPVIALQRYGVSVGSSESFGKDCYQPIFQ